MPLKAQFDSPSVREAMDRARSALSDNPVFIASLEPLWRSVMPTTSAADALNCSEDVWRWIAICRRPRADRFNDDIDKIARATNIDPIKLQHFIVTAIAVERFRDAPPDLPQDRMDLLAAREHDENDK
jgi:hypothetical protein